MNGRASKNGSGRTTNLLLAVLRWVGGTILFLAASATLLVVLGEAWYAPLYDDTLNECLTRPGAPDVSDGTAYADTAHVISLLPLGTICRIRDRSSGALIATLPPTSWAPTVLGYASALIAVALVVIAVVAVLRSAAGHPARFADGGRS